MADEDSPIRNVRWVGPDKSTAVVEVSGDVDLHSSAAFQEGLTLVLARRPQRIVLDLSAVAYMDSSGGTPESVE